VVTRNKSLIWSNGNDELAAYKLAKVDKYCIKFDLLKLRNAIKRPLLCGRNFVTRWIDQNVAVQ
jgi:hypothetical protein